MYSLLATALVTTKLVTQQTKPHALELQYDFNLTIPPASIPPASRGISLSTIDDF